MAERSVHYKGFGLTVEVPERVERALRRVERVVSAKASPNAPGSTRVGGPRQVSYERRDPAEGVKWIQDRIDWHQLHGNGFDVDHADPAAVARAVGDWCWYHSIELPHGIVTSGVYDHRAVVALYELPSDLHGTRVLDLATADGFWAFEFERRGAKVSALDIDSTADVDLPAPVRQLSSERGYADPIGTGFDLAHRLLKSRVERISGSIYDLDPDHLGRFDLVHAGDVLLHLRDPLLALQQIRRVTGGEALLADCFDPTLTSTSGRRLAEYFGGWKTATWWLPSLETLIQMVADAGFDEVRVVNTYQLETKGGGGPWRAILRAH
ncbi:MAG: class I SAM-dependent methyltransferase [Acidimicrobiales bacterium]